MVSYFTDTALLPSGWASNVRLEVDGKGDFAAVRANAAPDRARKLNGIAVPGMANVHSHAFQRAMAGLAERAGPEGDNFWSWREIMYRFLSRLTPDDVEAVAVQLYIELLKHGYTAVGEFHYVHNDPNGQPYANVAELADRVTQAARLTGIGLTLLPVLYQTGNFGGEPPTTGQRRFITSTDAFVTLAADLFHRHRQDPQVRVGIAPHSLRAVTPGALKEAVTAMRALDASLPVHIHAAEQAKEVQDCVTWSGQRPVEWLLSNMPVDAGWCLVHCTHVTPEERTALAQSQAVAGLCPTTEANLGDGLFPVPEYLQARGRFGIGSDSNVCRDPAEELRWIEYSQRLVRRARNIVETRIGASTGATLFREAAAGGAQALGRSIGALADGCRADLVVLDPTHPTITGRSGDLILDSWIFGGNETPVRDVMTGGRWVIRDGHHAHEEEAARNYRRAVDRLVH